MMDERYAISVRSRIQLENKLGLFSKCKSILQEINWIIENWEDSVKGYCLELGVQEISEAENSLYGAKRKIWRLCMNVSAKVESQKLENGKENLYNESPQPRLDYPPSEASSSRVQNVNKEMVLRENTCMPIAIHQPEARKQTFVMKNNPAKPPLKNLLLDWSVVLDINDKLCLQGNMPTEGEWMTSPIAVRLGETTVKTNSGTVYNVYGPMVVPAGENIPEFVQEKFHFGFPVDWEAVLKKWVATIKQNAENTLQATTRQMVKNNSDPYVMLYDVKKMHAVPTASTTAQQMETDEMPPPKTRPRKSKNIGSSQQEIQKPSPEQVITEKLSSTMNMDLTKILRRKVEVSNTIPRFSKRKINNYLLNNSVDASNPNMNESVTNEEDVKLLKMWKAEFSEECNGLILKGSLVNEESDVLDKNYTTTPVCHRLCSDLVETEDGQYYRLVGPSSLVFSDTKYFDYGFPADWKTLLVKLQALKNSNAPKTSHTQNKRNVSIAKQSNASRSEPINNTTIALTSSRSKKNHSAIIQHLIKDQISQGQTTMLEDRNNGSLMAKKGNAAAAAPKRKVETAPLVLQNAIPIKKKRTKATEEADVSVDDGESLGNISDTTEYQWKQQVQKKFRSGRSKVAEPVSCISKVDQGQSVKEAAVRGNDSKKPESKSKANVNDKYVLGLATDDCDSEFDFNIF